MLTSSLDQLPFLPWHSPNALSVSSILRPCPQPPWPWASTAPPSPSSSSSSSWPTTGCTWCLTRVRLWWEAASQTSARPRRRRATLQTPACKPPSGPTVLLYSWSTYYWTPNRPWKEGSPFCVPTLMFLPLDFGGKGWRVCGENVTCEDLTCDSRLNTFNWVGMTYLKLL